MKLHSSLSAFATLALGGLMFTSIACNDMEGEQRKADNKVRQAVQSSVKHRLNPTTREAAKEWDSAVADLNAAVNEKGASSTQKIRANSLLAEAEFEAGNRFVRDLNKLDPVIAATVWEISQVARQIQSVNDNAKALAASDPAATLKAIETKRTEMSTASAAAATKAGEFKTQIDAVKKEIDDLVKQKDAALAEADATATKASKASLKEAEPMLDAVTESRRKASNFGHAIDKTSAKLLPLERDMATEEAKKKAADEAIVALDASKKGVDGKWTGVQSEIAAQKTLAGTLGEQLAARAKTLDDLNKQASSLRTKALEQYEKCAKHSGAASNETKTLTPILDSWATKEKFREAPEAAAWKQLNQLYNLNVFKLTEAEANNAQGNLHAAAATQIAAQQKLVAAITKTLQEAGITMPATLAAEDPKKESDAANKAFTTAADQFDGVKSGRNVYPPTLKEAAQVSQMFALYGQYLNGDSTKLEKAKAIFTEVFGQRKTEPAVMALPADLRG